MPTDTTPAEHTGLISYQEAMRVLDKSEQAVRSLVWRGELHTQPDPHNKRRRLLSLAEVQAYAIKKSRQALPAPASALNTGAGLDMSSNMLGAVAGGIALLLLLVALFKAGGADAAMRVLVIGASAGVALLIIAEWQEQGRISTQEAKRLERLAKDAEANPDSPAKADTFMRELARMMEASGVSA